MSTPGVDRAVRKFQRSMQRMADESGTTVAVSAGDGPEVVIAAPGKSVVVDTTEAFVEAPEVAAIARELIDRFAGFQHLHEHRIEYLFQTAMPSGRGGCKTIGRAHVVNELYQAVTDGLGGIVVVNQPWWMTATDRQRQALVYHELCHYETDADTGALKTLNHDLEMFIGEAQHFGDWRSGIREVAEQLSVWQRAQD